MEAAIYNTKGEKVSAIKLPDTVFNLPWNSDLVYQVVLAMKSNQRTPAAHTKGRGEVAGGGKKPWRQKGLGRARHGSIRSPIWVGGGIAHGPTKDKNFSKKINAKMKRKAFYTVLSQKARDNEVLFLDRINLDQPKTKQAGEIISAISKVDGFEKLKTRKSNKAIVALDKREENVSRSFRNLPGVEIVEAGNLNILDVLNHKYLIIANPEGALTKWKPVGASK